MNILIISPFDLVVERFGGTTIRLYSLGKELMRQGHNVVLAGPTPFSGPKPPVLDGITLHFFRRPFHRYPYPDDGMQAARKRVNRPWRLPVVMASRFLEINRLIAREQIDVVYVSRAYLDTAYPAFLSHFVKKVPIICDWDDLEGVHGFSTMFKQPLAVQLLETFNEVVFPRVAGATVVASCYLKDFAINIGVPREKVYYAPTVGDSSAFNPAVDGTRIRERLGLAGKKVLLYVGSLEEGNGVRLDSMLHAMKMVHAVDPSFALLVVGEGSLLRKGGKKGELVELAEALELSGKVIFTGGVPYRDVPHYVAAADLCLALFPINLVTLTKSPLKVYEYMSAGKAVLGRSVGEVSICIKNGENGVLVYSDDPQEYADAIIRSFADEAYLHRLGMNARQSVDERFSWKHSAATVVRACEQLVCRQGRNTGTAVP